MEKDQVSRCASGVLAEPNHSTGTYPGLRGTGGKVGEQ